MEQVMLGALLAHRNRGSWTSHPVCIRLPTDQPIQLRNACLKIFKQGLVSSSYGPLKVSRPFKSGTPNWLLMTRGANHVNHMAPWWILQIAGWEITTHEYRGEERFEATASGLFCLHTAGVDMSMSDVLGVSIGGFSLRLRTPHYLKRKA